ncbi:precorrin-6A/cobalt-precorrin-6A reductase [Methanobacterium formicicum]|uniref:Precorrin-6x reductase n=1 Tax=Methanobacterium formicicum (strain DSM 3637 / PP1) TaxID=1204725 RepID=K2QB16_METFP|nr:precorrin-6A/cobalt-precorrin-6A reductase [Methanobacterium formicicum]EKF85161.1 precorrin-6x reductase [Methanobacterium formicicum DSM 3637]
MNVLVMAGTSDARKIISDLSEEERISVLATATTPHGVELAQKSGANKVLEGFFDSEKLTNIIQDNDIELLIDATHPFAAAATQNAIKASNTVNVPYIRFERPETALPDSDLIHHVHSFEDAALIIKEILDQSEYLNHESLNKSEFSKERSFSKSFANGKVLHLAGVNTIHYVTEVISPEFVVARVLPTVYSVKKSLELGIPHDNIIAMEGTFSPSFNGILMEEFQIKVVLTKESGQSGGTMSKIQAAIMGKVPVVIVMRPEIEELNGKLVFNKVELLVAEVISRSHDECQNGLDN